MCTRLSHLVQIKFTEIESILFLSIFPWRILVLDKERDAGGFSAAPFPPPPNMFLLYCLHCFLSRIIDKCCRLIQRYIAKTSHIRLPSHLDD